MQDISAPGSLPTPVDSPLDNYFDLQEASPVTFGATAQGIPCPRFSDLPFNSSSAEEVFDAIAPHFIEQLDPSDPCRAILENPSAAALDALLMDESLPAQMVYLPAQDPPLVDQCCYPFNHCVLFADLCSLALPFASPVPPAIPRVYSTAPGRSSAAFPSTIDSTVSTMNEVVERPITVPCRVRCGVCRRSFQGYDAVREHEKKNHANDKYCCFYCDREFTRNDVRRRHIKSQHKYEAAVLFSKERA